MRWKRRVIARLWHNIAQVAAHQDELDQLHPGAYYVARYIGDGDLNPGDHYKGRYLHGGGFLIGPFHYYARSFTDFVEVENG